MRKSLMAVSLAAIAATGGMGFVAQAMPVPRKITTKRSNSVSPKQTALEKEIYEHNLAVDSRKAEKKLRKGKR